MALTTAEVTALSRNSGTRRIREDTQGHDQGANQAQEDTGGAAGIRKDELCCSTHDGHNAITRREVVRVHRGPPHLRSGPS